VDSDWRQSLSNMYCTLNHLVGKTGWKLSNSSIAAAELEVRREGRAEATVILHCLDGSAFFAVGKK
jgi:hypothetical protein